MSRKHKLPIFYPHWNGNSNNFIPNGWIHLGILPQCGIYMRYLLIHYNEMSYMYVICLVFTTIAFLKRQTDDPSFSESRLKSFIINPISKQNFPRIRPWTFWSCTFFFFEWLNTFFEGGFYFLAYQTQTKAGQKILKSPGKKTREIK